MRSWDWQFFMLPFPVIVVTFQSVDLELLKCLGSFEIEKLILDPFSKAPVEFTIKCNIIPYKLTVSQSKGYPDWSFTVN